MTTAAPSTSLATIQPAFTDPERLALAGYLAGYRGLTREAYALVGCHNLEMVSDLQRYSWTADRHAVRSYSLISPPRTLWRRIRAVARSVTGAVVMSSQSGGRRFLARCGRCWL
jgi:hypothetical protein